MWILKYKFDKHLDRFILDNIDNIGDMDCELPICIRRNLL
jgi:hypothetical protein